MPKKTRLIALIDFSMYSHSLLELGERWCRIANAELLLLHQVAGLVPAMTEPEIKNQVIEAEKEEALTKLKKLAEEKISASTRVNFKVTGQNLLLALPELLKQDYNDFFLVGLKGTGMLKKIFMGSTATKIIEELNHTTVAVPYKLCADPDKRCNLIPQKIIITVSYKYPINANAFRNFLDTFKDSIQQLEFISVVHPDEPEEQCIDYLKSLTSEYQEYADHTTYQVFPGKDVFDKIKSHVRKDKDTILVVQKGSRDLTDLIFRKFLIGQLVDDGSIPLIILPL